MLKKIVLLTATAISAFALHMAELNINDKDLEIGATFDVGQFNDNIEPNTMFMGAKFLNPDISHSSDPISSIDPYYEVSFLMMREIGDNGMSIGLGIKLNYLTMNDEGFSSLPLGVNFAYALPFPNLVPMSVSGSLYYAPEVLCLSSSGNDYLEYKLYYDVELIKNAGITLGYRSINASYSNILNTDNINYNSSWYFGFKVKF
jgi:hypothetical protein